MLTKIAITLSPKIGKVSPDVTVSVPGYSVHETLWKTKCIQLEFEADHGWIEIMFVNKPEDDADSAVIIDQIEFFGISDPKFIWAGGYTPTYPEPWYSQQKEKPPAYIPQQNYLGWNGTWRLDFSIPVFTWMHKTLNLGWIYQ